MQIPQYVTYLHRIPKTAGFLCFYSQDSLLNCPVVCLLGLHSASHASACGTFTRHALISWAGFLSQFSWGRLPLSGFLLHLSSTALAWLFGYDLGSLASPAFCPRFPRGWLWLSFHVSFPCLCARDFLSAPFGVLDVPLSFWPHVLHADVVALVFGLACTDVLVLPSGFVRASVERSFLMTV